jgi:hypothetical protein
MLTNLISWFLWRINLLICSTLKYKATNEPPSQSLFATWHGQSFPLFYWAQHRKLCLLPIETWRGDAIAYLAERYGYRSIRLFEKGTPLERSKNLTELVKVIEQGYEVPLAVDGPPPPLIHHKAKPGILFLSQQTGVPVIPVGIKMKRKIVLPWRWDRYEIPLPWSEVEITFGRPFVATEKSASEGLGKEILRLGGEWQNAGS